MVQASIQKLGGVVLSKQHPEEESFKEKIMKSLNNPENRPTSSESKTATATPRREGASKQSQTTVGTRRQAQSSTAKQVKSQATSPQKKTAAAKTKSSPKSAAKAQTAKATTPVQRTSNGPKNEKKQEEYMRKKSREKENRVVNKIVTIVVITLLFVGGILGFSVYRYISSGLKPLDTGKSAKIAVEIPSGSSNKTIGEILEKENIIKSGMIFNYYTKFNNLTGFQAGNYNFSPSMTLDEISKVLQGGTGTGTADVKLTIPEGYTIDQIGDAIEKNLKIKKEEFLDLMKDEDFFNDLLKEYPNLLESASKAEGVRYRLEGYLFPATYDFYKGTDLKAFVTQMVAKSDAVMTPYYQEIKDKSLSVQEVLTLASLVEKEGNNENDRRKIAQVFFNRLAAPMPLQSDISILYALDTHKELVTLEDTQVDSPYNLYVNQGYGPGPFDNPSEQAIKAVLNPQANNYYYFVADLKTGQVYYAETFEEHQALVDQYVNGTGDENSESEGE